MKRWHDTNLSSYVLKANVDHTLSGESNFYQHLIPLSHHTYVIFSTIANSLDTSEVNILGSVSYQIEWQ